MDITLNTNKQYKQKPTRAEAGRMQGELKQVVSLSVEQIAKHLGSGCNCRASATECVFDAVDHHYKYQFKSQQLFLIDIDNSQGKILKPENAVNKALNEGIKPSFIYLTHSSSGNVPKYRIAFVMREPVFDMEIRNKLQEALISLYDGYADITCKDYNRMFFGGHSGVLWSDYGAVNDIDKVLSVYRGKSQNKAVQKPKTIKPKSGGHNISLIQKKDSKALRDRLQATPHTFENTQKFFEYVYSKLDLGELLEVQEGKTFKCIFHKDNHPSANVFFDGETWLYHCFGCGRTYNIKQIIEKLGDFKSEYQSIEFIKDIYKLDILETDWSIEQKANIDRILNCLARTDDKSFCELCPTADSNLRYAKPVFISMLSIARETIFPWKYSDDNILFYLSNTRIAQEVKGRKVNGKQRDKVSKYIKMLACHGLIDIVQDEDLPPDILQKALAGRLNHNGKHISFYRVPSWVVSRLEYIEAQGHIWKDAKMTLDGINYEGVYRTFGYEMAKSLYPQHATIHFTDKDEVVQQVQRTPTKRQETFHDLVQAIICSMVSEYGYTTKNKVIEALMSEGMTRSKAQERYKVSINEILWSNNLKQVRCNKALKQQYGVVEADNHKHPLIIIME